MEQTNEIVELNGVTVRLRRMGRGQPLLFMHGPDGLSDCGPFMEDLARDYEVIAADHPGFGGSSCPEWMDDISDLAYFYLDLLERLDLNNVHVVGHSLGGWIALEVAVRNRSRLRDLVLIASAGIHVKGCAKADIFMIDPDEQARLSYADPLLGEEAAIAAAADKYADIAIANRIASARFCWNPRFHNPRLRRWLRRADVPALVIWGDEDRIFPPPHGPELCGLLPRARLETVRKCGHLPHVEKRQETLALVRNFIMDGSAA